MNDLARRIFRALQKSVTVLIIPHTSVPLWRLQFTVNFFLFCLVLWSGITIWAGYLVGRNIDYWITKADNQVMRAKMGYLASEIDRSSRDLQLARETDEKMRQLLGMRSRRAIVENEEGIGGPNAADRVGLIRQLLNDPIRASQAAMHLNLKSLRRQSSERLASFQEINWYITNRRSLFRSTPVGWPTEGRITSVFGYRFSPILRSEEGESGEFHSGIDIANSPDTPILATADGTIHSAGWYGGYGRMILINHDWGYSTLYGHTSKVLVHEGDVVKRGQMIAYMGTTGRSTGDHLHYEVWRHGRPVNPIRYLKPHPDEDAR